MEPVKIQKEKIMSVYAKKDTLPAPKEKKVLTDEELGKRIVIQFLWDITSPIVLLFLWNWIMPGLFGLATIGYFKALGIVVKLLVTWRGFLTPIIRATLR
jgi:membrane protein insertase Oxa1/YidC/SpoIIIJ